MSATTIRKPRRSSKGGSAGWVPGQHGAWAMLILPFLVGLIYGVQDSGLHAVTLPLFALWMVGYFAFNALSLWLKSGRQARYLKAVQVYGAASAALGAVVLLLQPALLTWVPVYAPLLGIGLWRAAVRDDTSLLSRWVTVIAACLFCAVIFSDGFHVFMGQLGTDVQAQRTAKATLILLAYFLGTVLYVKTMIRERGQVRWVTASVAFHATCTLIAAWFAGLAPATQTPFTQTSLTQAQVTWDVPVFLLLTTIRAYAMPSFGPMQGRKITPKQVGLLEFGLSVLLLVVLLGLPA